MTVMRVSFRRSFKLDNQLRSFCEMFAILILGPAIYAFLFWLLLLIF